MGSDNACQTEVAVAYHMVSFTVSPRGHPEILREALCSSSWVFLLQISVFLVSLFSIFIYYPPFLFLYFSLLCPSLSHSSLFSCESYFCDLGFTFFKASKSKVIAHLPGRHLHSTCHNMGALCSVKGHHSIEISLA